MATLEVLDAALRSVDGVPIDAPAQAQPDHRDPKLAAAQRTVLIEVTGQRWWAVTLVPPRARVQSGPFNSSPPPQSGASVALEARKVPDLLAMLQRRHEQGKGGGGPGAAAKLLAPGSGVRVRGRMGLLRELGAAAAAAKRAHAPDAAQLAPGGGGAKLSPGDFLLFWDSLNAHERGLIDSGQMSIDEGIEKWLRRRSGPSNGTSAAELAAARAEPVALREAVGALEERLAEQEQNACAARAALAARPVAPPASMLDLGPVRCLLAAGILSLWATGLLAAAAATAAAAYLGTHALLLVSGLFDGGTLRRAAAVWAFALRMISSYVAVKIICSRLEREDVTAEETDAVWDRNHEHWARAIHAFIVRHKGLWVKAAQAASSRPEIIPPPFVRELSKLQDALPALPAAELRAAAEAACGADTFDSWDDKPLGSASIAQVHRATLRASGEVVAVKVRKPGVERSMYSDLRALRRIWTVVYWVDRGFDMRKIADMWDRAVHRELNFRLEGAAMDRVRRCLEAAGVAAVVPQLRLPPAEGCLVMEFIDGCRLDDKRALSRAGGDAALISEALCAAMSEQLFGEGLFNADQHMGNILAVVRSPSPGRGPTPLPCLLDFGNCEEIAQGPRAALAALLVAAHRRDSAGACGALEALGLRLGGVLSDPHRALIFLRFVFRDVDPDIAGATARRKEFIKWSKDERKQRGRRLGKKHGKFTVDEVPDELLPVFRMVALLHGACASLGARTPLLARLSERAAASLRPAAPLPPPAPPSDAGEPAVVAQLWAVLRGLLSRGDVSGAQVHLERADGTVIASLAIGRLGEFDGRPVTPATPFPLYGASMGVVACTVHRLAAEGRLSLRDPIAAAWPEFGAAGKGELTLGDALSHRCGLGAALPRALVPGPSVEHSAGLADRPRLLSAVAEAAPDGRVRPHLWTIGSIVDGALRPQGTTLGDEVGRAAAEAAGARGEVGVGPPPDGEPCAVLGSQLVAHDLHPPGSVDDATGAGVEDEVDAVARHAGLDLSEIAQGREWLAEPRVVNLAGCAQVAGISCFASARAACRMHRSLLLPAPAPSPRRSSASGRRRRPPADASAPPCGGRAAAPPPLADYPEAVDELGQRWRGGFRVLRVRGLDAAEHEALGSVSVGGQLVLAVPHAGVIVAVLVNTLTPGAAAVRHVADAVGYACGIGLVQWD